jgi:hypothetical protein
VDLKLQGPGGICSLFFVAALLNALPGMTFQGAGIANERGRVLFETRFLMLDWQASANRTFLCAELLGM